MPNKLPFDNTEEPSTSNPGDKELIKQLSSALEKQKKESETLRKELTSVKNFNEERIKYRPDKTFGLNVCGDVMLNKMEVEIVNTPAFQRLAFVNQLGSTNTVYRSANHTRFEHSLGVLKMADIMVQKIRNNKHSEADERMITLEQEQIIRLLALLHDIGHMPFGHTIEDEFNIFPSHDKHESRWDFFLGESSVIGSIIIKHAGTDENGAIDLDRGKIFYQKFFRLIKCEKDFSGFEDDAFMYDIVSNTVCADLLDYLARDCQYTNLKINFHPRFLDYLIIKNVKNDKSNKNEKRIVIRLCKTGSKQPRKDIQSELVQLLRNRYYLGERVYYHHTKIKTGTLIAGAVLRAEKAGFFKYLPGHSKDRMYTHGDSALFDIHNWGDVKLLVKLEEIIINKTGQQAKYLEGALSLVNSYLNRDVYYQLHFEDRDTLGLKQNRIDEVLSKKIGLTENHILERKLLNRFSIADERLKQEEFITDLLPDMISGDFLIYFPSYKMQMKLADVKVEDQDGIVRPLRKCNQEIINAECKEIIVKHQNLWMLRVLIHPKFSNSQHPAYKTEYRSYLKILEKYCKWIFARNDQEELEFGQEFWKDIIDLKIDTELDGTSEEGTLLYNPIKNGAGRKNRTVLVTELADELASGHTRSGRGNKEIKEIISSRFKANSKLQ